MPDNIYVGITDSYGGWLHGIVHYYDGDDVVGYVDYQLNNNEHEIYINMIKVDDNYKRHHTRRKEKNDDQQKRKREIHQRGVDLRRYPSGTS